MKKALVLFVLILGVSLAFVYFISTSRDIQLENSVWLSPVTSENSAPTASIKFYPNNRGVMYLLTDAPDSSDVDGWPKKFEYVRNGDDVIVTYLYNTKNSVNKISSNYRIFHLEDYYFLVSKDNDGKFSSKINFGAFRYLVLADVQDSKWNPMDFSSLKEVIGKSITKAEFESIWNP